MLGLYSPKQDDFTPQTKSHSSFTEMSAFCSPTEAPHRRAPLRQ
jgi:hypothetical protein